MYDFQSKEHLFCLIQRVLFILKRATLPCLQCTVTSGMSGVVDHFHLHVIQITRYPKVNNKYQKPKYMALFHLLPVVDNAIHCMKIQTGISVMYDKRPWGTS